MKITSCSHTLSIFKQLKLISVPKRIKYFNEADKNEYWFIHLEIYKDCFIIKSFVPADYFISKGIRIQHSLMESNGIDNFWISLVFSKQLVHVGVVHKYKRFASFFGGVSRLTPQEKKNAYIQMLRVTHRLEFFFFWKVNLAVYLCEKFCCSHVENAFLVCQRTVEFLTAFQTGSLWN